MVKTLVMKVGIFKLFLPDIVGINMQKRIDSTVEIVGVNISGTDRGSVLRRLFLQRKDLLHVATVNPEFVIEARRNLKFAKALEAADETVADGWGIVWAAWILYSRKIPRISGHMLVDVILKRSAEDGKKVFLLGGAPGVSELAATEIKRVYPNIKIGWYEGSSNVRAERRDEMGLTLAKINSFEPDFLLVAYGSPWQDLWIEENREYLRVSVAIGVGGVLDEWAGVVKKTPRVIDMLGLKWFWRLVLQPKRWRRQISLLQFMVLVVRFKLFSHTS